MNENPNDKDFSAFEDREATEQEETETGTNPGINYGLPPMLEDDNAPSNFEDANGLIRLNEFWSYHPKLHTIGLTKTLEQIDMDKFERQSQSNANEANARGLTLMIDYAASGEGRHVYYLRVLGMSEDEARDYFRSHFFVDLSDDDWTKWSAGLHVHRGAYWPEFLHGFLVPPDELEMHWFAQ
jgi:hypothetical protein